MSEKFQELKIKLAEMNEKYSKKTKILVGSIVAGILLVSLIIAVVLNNQPYEVLYSGLTEQESSELVGKLQAQEVPCKLESNGTILVPKEQEPLIKAQFASEGYPKSGFTYDVFKENIDLMTTDYEKISYKLFYLQDRIAATISMYDGVKEARVTIALGDDKKYVMEQDKTETSAAVVVIMDDGGSPTADQVSGIRRLVSKSIPGTKIENIVITDGSGIEVTADDSNGQMNVSQLKLDLEKEVEKSVRGKVLHILTPIYGDNIRVAVKSSVDVDKKIREIITYTPQENGKGIPGKEVIGGEAVRGDDGVGGIPGTETNAEIPVYPGITTDGTEIYFKNEQAYDYLVDQVKEQIQSDSGVVSDTAVAVTLDGADMTVQQTTDLKNLIATTAGIPRPLVDEKVSLLNATFIQPETTVLPEGFSSKTVIAISAGAGLLLLLVIVLIVMMILKKKKRQKALEEEMALAALQLAELEDGDDASEFAGIDLANIKKTREDELRDQIREFADVNPEISAQLIKTWLRGGNDD